CRGSSGRRTTEHGNVVLLLVEKPDTGAREEGAELLATPGKVEDDDVVARRHPSPPRATQLREPVQRIELSRVEQLEADVVGGPAAKRGHFPEEPVGVAIAREHTRLRLARHC